MKRTLLIIFPICAVAIVATVMFVLPVRFRLESTSPSGNLHVRGLRFQGQNAHTLDGTLRLFVTDNKLEINQQTLIPWGSDLAIKWRDSKQGEVFAVEKKGRAVIEFQFIGDGLKCTNGAEYLTDDPYKQESQNKSSLPTGNSSIVTSSTAAA